MCVCVSVAICLCISSGSATCIKYAYRESRYTTTTLNTPKFDHIVVIHMETYTSHTCAHGKNIFLCSRGLIETYFEMMVAVCCSGLQCVVCVAV